MSINNNSTSDKKDNFVVSTLIDGKITPVISFSNSKDAFTYIDKKIQEGSNKDWLVE
jgi:hypothetical protein